MRSLWEAIDHVRVQPESIRRRYLYGCVATTMVFIIGVWILSVHESFQSATVDTQAVGEQLSKTITKPSNAPSLSDLVEQGKSITVDSTPANLESMDFFENQQRVKNVPSDEGAVSENSVNGR